MSNETQAPSGAELIARERQRQIEDEGYTAEHDAHHGVFELRDAALAYAGLGAYFWPSGWGTPPDAVLSVLTVDGLTKAGALIAAAIDRFQADEVFPMGTSAPSTVPSSEPDPWTDEDVEVAITAAEEAEHCDSFEEDMVRAVLAALAPRLVERERAAAAQALRELGSDCNCLDDAVLAFERVGALGEHVCAFDAGACAVSGHPGSRYGRAADLERGER